MQVTDKEIMSKALLLKILQRDLMLLHADEISTKTLKKIADTLNIDLSNTVITED